MKLSDLFFVDYGVNLELSSCEITDDSSGINFVGRTAENNGVVARVKPVDGVNPQPAGVLSCAGGGSVLSTFLQTEPFYSGRDLYILTPKKEMSLEEKLFYCHTINMNAYRYSFGRQANKTLKDIELPEFPQWIKTFKVDLDSIKTKNNKPLDLEDSRNWGWFTIGDLFKVSGTKTTKLDDLESYGEGVFPYVTTQASNNGIAGYYDYMTEMGNCLIADSAVLGFCTYQEKNFSASDHVEKLIPKFKLNKYIGLFLVTILNRDNYKYSYGRKFNQTNIKNTRFKLPVTRDGSPNWAYMESYIKSLPHSDNI
jgi:hypothetical protein